MARIRRYHPSACAVLSQIVQGARVSLASFCLRTVYPSTRKVGNCKEAGTRSNVRPTTTSSWMKQTHTGRAKARYLFRWKRHISVGKVFVLAGKLARRLERWVERGRNQQHICCPFAKPTIRRLDPILNAIIHQRNHKTKCEGYACAAASGGGVLISGPDGYKYKAIPSIEGRKERFVSVGLKVSDLPASTAYWCDLLGMSKFSAPAPASEPGDGVSETVGYGEEQVTTRRLPLVMF